jgi:hypothetical protein
MTDPNDLLLSALFQDADEDQQGLSAPAFTQHVMTRVVEAQAKRKALIDSLLLGLVACVAVVGIVLAPTAWPQIEAVWLKNTASYGLNGQNLALIGILLLSGLGWAVAVKE